MHVDTCTNVQLREWAGAGVVAIPDILTDAVGPGVTLISGALPLRRERAVMRRNS